MFRRHHYLSHSLHRSATCFAAMWEQTPVAFVAVLPLMGFTGRKRISRVVVQPDYQGIGIGRRVTGAVARHYRGRGHRVNISTSHPAMIAALRSDASWKCVNIQKHGGVSQSNDRRWRVTAGRPMAGFEFVES